MGRIRDALDQDRFVLYAQPILDLTTNRVVQHELLLRMVTYEGEIVHPDRFLPTAEEFGLISEIDRWVVSQTARLAAKGYPEEFNLSAKSGGGPRHVDAVRNALGGPRRRPELVVCEITETALFAIPVPPRSSSMASTRWGAKSPLMTSAQATAGSPI